MRMFDKVVDEARNHAPLRLLLTLLAVPFVVLGWFAGVVVKLCGFVLVWAWAAIKVGFRDGRGRRE